MKIRKRSIVIGGVILSVVLAGFGVFAAWGPGGWSEYGPRFRPWGSGFHHGPFSGRDMHEFVLWKLDSKMEELKLTPLQKEKYGELRTRIKGHFSAAKEERKRLREDFRAEMAKETPDVAGLTKTMKKKIQDVSGIMQTDLDLIAVFYGSLDNMQKQKVVSGIREKMAGKGPCGEEQQ